MNVVINKKVDIKKWDQIIKKSYFSSPFQSKKFYDFFNFLDSFSADVFAVEESGVYVALVVVTVQKEKGIKSFFSKRAIIYGGPLIIGNNKELLVDFFRYINTYYSGKLIYIEIRNYFDYSDFNDAFVDSGFKYIPWLNFHLDTTDIIQMKKRMSSSRLRQIKKAIKNGAHWKVADNLNDVEVFYNILFNLYKDKIKKPLFPKEFFIEFFKRDLGVYLLVYFKEDVIGGIMCPIMPMKAIYEFYICGLDKEYRNQYPSVMATWAAMEFASQNKIPLFDFMGAGSPDDNYGVREFKSRFGGDEVEYGRFLKVLNPALYKIGVWGINILSNVKK